MEPEIGPAGQRVAVVAWRPVLVVVLLASYFTLFGMLIGAQGVLWAEVIRVLGMSEGTFGTVQLISPLVSVFLLLSSSQISARLGKKRVSLVALAIIFISCLTLAAVNTLPILIASLLLSGLGNGLMEAGMNGAAIDWERSRGRAVMNTMHACFSAGAVVGALLAGQLLQLGFGYSGVLLLFAALYVVALLFTLPIAFPPAEMQLTSEGSFGATLRLISKQRALLALSVICMLGVLAEGVPFTWSVIYLRDDLQAPAIIGGISFALFNGAMFFGRLANQRLVDSLGARRSMMISGVGMILGTLLLVSVTDVWVATLALVLLGVAVAGVVPTVLTAAGQVVPGSSGTIAGAVMAMAYTSFVIGAPLVGWLAEFVTLRWSFLTVLVCGVAVLILSLGLQREAGE